MMILLRVVKRESSLLRDSAPSREGINPSPPKTFRAGSVGAGLTPVRAAPTDGKEAFAETMSP